jgi:hypothetical protein
MREERWRRGRRLDRNVLFEDDVGTRCTALLMLALLVRLVNEEVTEEAN